MLCTTPSNLQAWVVRYAVHCRLPSSNTYRDKSLARFRDQRHGSTCLWIQATEVAWNRFALLKSLRISILLACFVWWLPPVDSCLLCNLPCRSLSESLALLASCDVAQHCLQILVSFVDFQTSYDVAQFYLALPEVNLASGLFIANSPIKICISLIHFRTSNPSHLLL